MGKSGAPAVTSVMPSSVTAWTSFEASVGTLNLDAKTAKHTPPVFEDTRVYREEGDIVSILRHDLNRLSALNPGAQVVSAATWGAIIGKPDLACIKEEGNTRTEQDVLFHIEVKRPENLQSDNIVQDYNNAEPNSWVISSVSQIFRYMRLLGHQYGVLTTGSQTWFIQRVAPNTDDIRMSRAIGISQAGPSLLECYLWLIRETNNSTWVLDPPEAGSYYEKAMLENGESSLQPEKGKGKKVERDFRPSTYTKRSVEAR